MKCPKWERETPRAKVCELCGSVLPEKKEKEVIEIRPRMAGKVTEQHNHYHTHKPTYTYTTATSTSGSWYPQQKKSQLQSTNWEIKLGCIVTIVAIIVFVIAGLQFYR